MEEQAVVIALFIASVISAVIAAATKAFVAAKAKVEFLALSVAFAASGLLVKFTELFS